MPYDPIERWEWEGGAVAVDATVPEEGRAEDVTEGPAEPDAHPEPSSSTSSSRDRP
jgi:hypothetical protein